MSKLGRLPQTQEAKQNYSDEILLEMLASGIDRKELASALGISDTGARSRVAECSMYFPVLRGLNRKGYRLAKKIDNLSEEQLRAEYEEVMFVIHDISSRIKCLKKRLKPLIAYKVVAERKLNDNKEVK